MHEIALSETVLARAKARRGKVNPFETIETARTALLVVDMQTVFCRPDMPAYGPVAEEIKPNVNRLAAAVRAAGGLVVWIQMAATPESQRDWAVYFDSFCSPELRAGMIAGLTPGSEGHQIAEGLDVHPKDVRSQKTRFSALIQGSSDLDALLRARGVDTVVVCGTVTNVCCESTARDAMMRNFRVLMVSDGNAAATDAEHAAALSSIYLYFGDVQTTAEVIARLEASAAARAAAE